jgi:primosomal protein N' (replication factor Y)
MPILTLAMPTPLRRSFDYLPPEGFSDADMAALQPGARVLAPFGNRKLVGILLAVKSDSEIAADKLKPAIQILDQQSLLTPNLLSLCQWAAAYYQHPIGDVFSNALPTLLRKGEALIEQTQLCWRLTTEGKGLPVGALKSARKQAQLLALLQQHEYITNEQLNSAELTRSIAKALVDKGLAESFNAVIAPAKQRSPADNELALTFSEEQQYCFDQIDQQQGYNCYLLEGVTGSGKTEVYLQLIDQCLQRGQQALVLIPEIGLTPQTVSRFQRRFNCQIALLHSGLTDRERLLAWQAANTGTASIIIGTRSAVFTPLAKPGIIIIDEEHDNSFKQQDGFRYNARDIAIKRAHQEQCPIVLGSATPSLESLQNALQGRYQHLQITQRAAGASSPQYQLIDIRNAVLEDGFSPSLITAIGDTINQGNQVLVFINRRGFSPMLMCHDCGYVAQCNHCDARMTVHFKQRILRCHHCEGQQPLPSHCPDCQSPQLDFRGTGTERSEQALNRLFPATKVIRIDRDTTSRKQAMQDLVADVHTGEPCILVGTQMLAKGHHFPDVTLVAVLDADGGLFSTDFRGPEKMGQLLVQVAGRAGRASKPGTVIIQTHQPEHPLINSLITQNYHQYALQLLTEREHSGLPPFGYLALLRAEGSDPQHAEEFLQQLRQTLDQQHADSSSATQLFGPLPAPMARRAGFFRAQLLVHAKQRKQLHQCLQLLSHYGDQHPLGKKLRWSIDVDPIDMF